MRAAYLILLNCHKSRTNKPFTSFGFPQVANFNPSVGSNVWVEDRDEAWIDGEVVEVNGEDIKVLCTSGKHVSVLLM